MVDITQVLKSPAGHEKFKIVLTEGKIKFSFLEKVGFLTNFGKQGGMIPPSDKFNGGGIGGLPPIFAAY